MRLIDADALLLHIKDLPTWWADACGVYGRSMKYPEGMFDCEDVVSSIENTKPTVDAVPVIRCKNCRFVRFNTSGTRYCTNSSGLAGIMSDDFCSYAQKKEAPDERMEVVGNGCSEENP